jgi:tyrosine-protein phosphatase SIW14
MILPNFHKVSDDLCRGAQPDTEGFLRLLAMGVKTIISLRYLHTDRWLIRDLGFRYHHIRMWAWHPEREDIDEFLRIMTLRCQGDLPVFVHCAHGSDRTGCMVAAYRVRVQGWTKEDAIKEMLEEKYGFHHVYEEIVLKFLNKL